MTKHQHFLSKQKIAEHQIFLPVPSLNTLGKGMLHAGEKYLLHKYHRTAANYVQVYGSCIVGLGSSTISLDLSVHNPASGDHYVVEAICKQFYYTLYKMRVQQNCAFFPFLLAITAELFCSKPTLQVVVNIDR